MATIVIHAGMPKTGSTSVQQWISSSRERLRQDYGVHVAVATCRTRRNPTDEVHLEPYEGGGVNSGRLIRTWKAANQAPEIARRFIAELSRFADEHPTVLVTAEGLSQAFWRVDETFLAGFEDLAQRHEVRVAYYVRPQHSAIEAGWREGGYKLTHTPCEFVGELSKQMHYLETRAAVRRHAPHVRFCVRPFRRDLLDGANPVRDFARRFLQVEDFDKSEFHANPGLPLELVNILRHAPEGWFWYRDNVAEPHPRRLLRQVFDGLVVDESPRIRRSRLLLQQHCHEVFETENRELIRELGWSTDHFVPSAEGLDGGWNIAELDALWEPDASPTERAFLYRALRAALSIGQTDN